jgi:thiosulfate dehydrogenase
MKDRDWRIGIALVVALAAGLGAGYLLWGWPTNWYARDVTNLPASPENDVIRYGHSLIIDTATHIGKAAADPQKRYAGNDLACGVAISTRGSDRSPLPSSRPSQLFPCWWTIR